jgi:predicted DNA binding CopG/RHH family protein
MGKEFNQIEYQNRYMKEKYDRIGLMVPKGRKDEIKEQAASRGMSVNEYINRLIEADMEAGKEGK